MTDASPRPDTPCPKCGHVRQPGEPGPSGECPRCGIVFAKYAAHQAALLARRPVEPEGDDAVRWYAALWATPDQVDPTVFWGRAAAWVAVALWAAHFIRLGWRDEALAQSFLHLANLPFHEFGHLLFRPFGRFMMFLGGSLFQVLWPLILGGLFVWRYRNPFGGAVCLAWAGQSLKELAPYIGDAQAMAMPLIMEYSEDIVDMRPERHDWHNILDALGWLAYDTRLAALASLLGSLTMLLAVAWGAWLLYRQWPHRGDTV